MCRHLNSTCRPVGVCLQQSAEKGVPPRAALPAAQIAEVVELIEIAVERGRRTRPDIKLGICGEHGGDPASIAFCETVGLD